MQLGVLMMLLSVATPSFSDDDPKESDQTESNDVFESIKEAVKESVEDVRDNPYQIEKSTIQEEFIEPLESESNDNSETDDNQD